jgi:hypothetical protein
MYEVYKTSFLIFLDCVVLRTFRDWLSSRSHFSLGAGFLGFV